MLLLAFFSTISLQSAADVYQKVEKTSSQNSTFSQYRCTSAAVCLLFLVSCCCWLFLVPFPCNLLRTSTEKSKKHETKNCTFSKFRCTSAAVICLFMDGKVVVFIFSASLCGGLCTFFVSVISLLRIREHLGGNVFRLGSFKVIVSEII